MNSFRSLTRLFLVTVLALAAGTTAVGQGSCGDVEHNCFTVALTEPGCNNPECCTQVCWLEPACCDIGWDEICVALAKKLCNDCGAVSNSCLEPSKGEPACRQATCCAGICGTGFDPTCCEVEWDENCAALAQKLCAGCGGLFAGPCLVVHDTPGCADEDCCNTVCAFDPNCCETTWDERCTQWADRFCCTCGSPCAASCFWEHSSPYCNDGACCTLVCDADPFCCDSSWDFSCAQLANFECCKEPPCVCGNPAAGPCKTPHDTPACNDFRCCSTVCSIDSFCCTVEWDTGCTQIAESECALGPFTGPCENAAGDCFVIHKSPGCDDPSCCTAVCEAGDAFCCDTGWDAACVERAAAICTDCGDYLAGSCVYPHSGPGCSDAVCCETVCELDPTCCSFRWDELCAQTAVGVCKYDACGSGSSAALRRPCTLPSIVPGCSDTSCCEAICANDQICCEQAWDETCAAAAALSEDCGQVANCPTRGDPFEVHNNPGCVDVFCCSVVCAVEPVCCQINWDLHCVDIAVELCYTRNQCPGLEPCDRSHASPGCAEPQCCQIVCSVDPTCCSEGWDTGCVAEARGRCKPATSWECPCFGDCFEEHANGGCEDAVCCAGVCSIDITCCDVLWDQGCASLARVTCCGRPGCGDFCAGPCLEIHASPYCNDPICCESVCRFDPSCCENAWDGFCVGRARTQCRGGCGFPGGNCFAAHELPGCSDLECCQKVCDTDPVCCEEEWDKACVESADKLCAGNRPECGDVGLPDCCLPHDSPGCFDRNCCDSVGLLDPFCVESKWDEACVELTYRAPGCEACQFECGEVCAGPCCEAKRTPWCSDEACCDFICNLDVVCCTIAWDETCAQTASVSKVCQTACPDPPCGDPAAGDCCLPHEQNGNCNDVKCCEQVIAIDDACAQSWDFVCAQLAREVCEVCEAGKLFCGSPDAGNCCTPHSTPYCSDEACCFIVCKLNPSCCEIAWDELCVKYAIDACGCGGQ